jgi:hypothetical protein
MSVCVLRDCLERATVCFKARLLLLFAERALGFDPLLRRPQLGPAGDEIGFPLLPFSLPHSFLFGLHRETN